MVQKKYSSILIALIIVLALAFIVADVAVLTKRDTSVTFAFGAYSNTTPIYTNSVNTVFNFSITADATFAINETNFTLTGCPNFMANFSSAGTNAIGNLTNISTNQLSWKNYTSSAVLGYMIPAGETKYFWFNITSPNNNETGCELVLNTTDFRGVTNSTKIAIIVDTIIPNITLQFNYTFSNWTSRTLYLNYSANDTNINHTVISVYWHNNATLMGSSTNISTINANQTTRTSITVPLDGRFNITIYASDKAGNSKLMEIDNITIDTTGPNVTIPLGVRYGVNLTGQINITDVYDASTGYFNLSTFANDVWGNVTVFFNVTNTTTIGKSTRFAGTLIPGTFKYLNDDGFNLSRYADGLYYVTIWANDTWDVGNQNLSESYRIALDRTKPSVAISRSSASNQTHMAVTITTADDTTGVANCTSSRGTVTGTTSVTEDSLDCGTTYTYNITCSDYVGNTNSSTLGYATDACPTTSGGSGGSSATPSELATGFTKTLYAGGVVSFKSENKSHTFILLNVKSNSAEIQISSITQKATLAVGEEKKFDLNNDTKYDVSVKLVSIQGTSQATITLKSISEAVSGEAPLTGGAVDTTTAGATAGTADNTKGKSSLWIWIVAIVVIIAAVAGYIIYSKKKRY